MLTVAFGPASAQAVPGPEPLLPATPYDYTVGVPAGLADSDNTPASNPTTDAGATLGRVLFYDRSLSANGTISCASCHDQAAGFSDPNTLSIRFDGETTRRHSMSLANAAFFEPGTFFWDTRAETLEVQVLQPFVDEVEMGLTLPELVSLVESQPYYAELFEDAFGSSEVSTDRISQALSQFVRSIVSTDAPYDEGRARVGRAQDPFPNFTASENRGKALFFGGGPGSCAGCHTTDAQINADNGPMNNGLDLVSTIDLGAFEVTGRVQDTGAFKVPSLRNIAESGPYMHDGRFETLREVVEHYSSGVQDHPQLHRRLQGGDGQPINRNFSEEQIDDMVAFLETLSDPTLLTGERFSDPFVESNQSCAAAGVDDDQLSAQVGRLYEAFFGRAPDAGGLQHWMSERANGASVADVATAFAGSDEFRNAYGDLSDAAYIDLVYRNVLFRPADAGGASFWAAQLASGASRGDVMTAFSESPENIERTGGDPVRDHAASSVVRLYAAVFQRAPDEAGLDFWANRYRSGVSLDDIASSMITAPEFVERYGSLGDSAFVNQVYCNVLGRSVDAAGGSYWLAELSTGVTRGTLMTGFSESPEFIIATDSLPS